MPTVDSFWSGQVLLVNAYNYSERDFNCDFTITFGDSTGFPRQDTKGGRFVVYANYSGNVYTLSTDFLNPYTISFSSFCY
jgi:hypothetical protein